MSRAAARAGDEAVLDVLRARLDGAGWREAGAAVGWTTGAALARARQVRDDDIRLSGEPAGDVAAWYP